MVLVGGCRGFLAENLTPLGELASSMVRFID